MNYFSQDFIVFVAIFFLTVRSHLLEPPTGFFFIVRCEDDFDSKPEACHKQEEEEEEAKAFLLPVKSNFDLEGSNCSSRDQGAQRFFNFQRNPPAELFCFRTRQSQTQ